MGCGLRAGFLSGNDSETFEACVAGRVSAAFWEASAPFNYFFAGRVKYSVSRFESIWERSMGGQRARTVEPSSAS